MERATELYAAVNLLVMGLSHMVQPRLWVDFFIWLRGQGHLGVFINGFLSLIFGSIVVAFHNVWSGLPTILTVFGWLQVVKALVSFVRPQSGLRSLERVSHERSSEFVVMGGVFVAFGAFFAFLALR